MIAIGLEGSANKLGVGVILHPAKGKGEPQILSNIRHTYVSPPGEGFLPKDTAIHHRSHVATLVKRALEEAGIKIADVDVSDFPPPQVHNHHELGSTFRFGSADTSSAFCRVFGTTVHMLHQRSRNVRALAVRRDRRPDTVSALVRPPRGRQPLRGAHRDGPGHHGGLQPGGPVRVRGQHPGHRLHVPAVPHLRRGPRHRRGQLPRPVRPHAPHPQRPGPGLQHRAARKVRARPAGPPVRRQGHGRQLLRHLGEG